MADAQITPTPNWRFESDLEDLVKRLDPERVAVHLAERFGKTWPPGASKYPLPPHVVARIFEATCAYRRTHYKYPLTQRQYAKLYNLCNDRLDPFQWYALAQLEDTDRWGLAAYREQLELQFDTHKGDAYRILRLLADNNRLLDILRKQKHAYGRALFVEHFITLTSLIHARLLKESSPIDLDQLAADLDDRWQTESRPVIAELVRAMSRSANEFGKLYREDYKAIEKDHMKGMRRSRLLETPILLTDEKRISSPLPHLLGRFLALEFVRRINSINANAKQAVEDQFEDYLEEWLRHCSPNLLMRERDLSVETTTRRCDYVCRCDDEIVLIEAKLAGSLPNFVTPEAISQHGLVNRITDGIEQVLITAKEVADGRIEKIEYSGQRMYGAVIVFEELPFANKDFFYEKVVLPKLKKINDVDSLLGRLSFPPQIIAVRDFERICCYLAQTRTSVTSLMQYRRESDYNLTGDWGRLVYHMLGDARLNFPDFVRERCDRFRDRWMSDRDE